jgi:hypothetical protein
MEQFRNSPLIHHKDIKTDEFRISMCEFVANAIKHKQLAEMEPEMFWALAYAPFYTLVKFHLQKRSMMSDSYRLTQAKMKKTLSRIILSLQP